MRVLFARVKKTSVKNTSFFYFFFSHSIAFSHFFLFLSQFFSLMLCHVLENLYEHEKKSTNTEKYTFFLVLYFIYIFSWGKF